MGMQHRTPLMNLPNTDKNTVHIHKYKRYSLHTGEEVVIGIDGFDHPDDVMVGKYIIAMNDSYLLHVSHDFVRPDEYVGRITEHTVILHTWKELWDLFVKIVLKKPRVNTVRMVCNNVEGN